MIMIQRNVMILCHVCVMEPSGFARFDHHARDASSTWMDQPNIRMLTGN